jgi:hypothetical protein
MTHARVSENASGTTFGFNYICFLSVIKPKLHLPSPGAEGFDIRFNSQAAKHSKNTHTSNSKLLKYATRLRRNRAFSGEAGEFYGFMAWS